MLVSRLKAYRQLQAIRTWCRWRKEYGKNDPIQGYGALLFSSAIMKNALAAEGYFKAKDWIGVESCYLSVRQIIDRSRSHDTDIDKDLETFYFQKNKNFE